MNPAPTSEGRPVTSPINTNRPPAANAVAHIGTTTVAITLSIGPAEARSLMPVAIHRNGSITPAAARPNDTAAVAPTSMTSATIATACSIITPITPAA
jgi:hypothetical protein